MLPKDLLVDLESGDRTAEHLEKSESVSMQEQLSQIERLMNRVSDAGQMQGLMNQQQAMQNVYLQPVNLGQQLSGQSLQEMMGQANPGGIIRW